MKYVFAFISVVCLIGCSDDRDDQGATSGPVRVAVLPDQSKNRLVSKYASLLAYLERETSLRFTFTIPADYSDLLDQFNAGQIDLAWFGGLTFTQASESSNAIPLVFRGVDSQFTSCYLAKVTDTRKTIGEFEGESFSFGPPLSTSGHLMPRFYMAEAGINPEQLFTSIRYSSGHDETAMLVSDGTVPLAVANCVIVQSLFESGVLDNSEVQIVETTPPYSNYVWAVRASMDEGTKISLRDAFLALDASVPEHQEVLRSQGARAYFPAGKSDFQSVRLAAIQAGILLDEGDR